VSRPVDIHDVARHLADFGERAELVTVGSDLRPHVVSVLVELTGDQLVTRVGASTAGNIAERPGVTLTWLPPGDGEYMLILDGAGTVVSQGEGPRDISIRIERGILHRLAGRPDTGPSCVTL